MIKVAFFDAKAYDKPSFEHYDSEHDKLCSSRRKKMAQDLILDLSKARLMPGLKKHLSVYCQTGAVRYL